MRSCQYNGSWSMTREDLLWAGRHSQPCRGEVAAALSREGFVFVPRYRPDLDTATTAALLGAPEKLQGIPAVQRLAPRTVHESTPNVYSGNFGLVAFPLHTDLAHWFSPPRFLMLRCLRGDSRVATYVVPWTRLLKGFALSKATRARFRPRRAVNGRLYLLPFHVKSPEIELRRWDSVFLKADNTEAVELARHLERVTATVAKFVFRYPGDTLLIDNWRVLHGRSAVPSTESKRLVERVYLREVLADDY